MTDPVTLQKVAAERDLLIEFIRNFAVHHSRCTGQVAWLPVDVAKLAGLQVQANGFIRVEPERTQS